MPLIGFAGAPVTLASDAIEGGHSNNFAHTKSLMYGHPAAWHTFCDLIAGIIGDYLFAQFEAGVDRKRKIENLRLAVPRAGERVAVLRRSGDGCLVVHRMLDGKKAAEWDAPNADALAFSPA